MAKAFSFGIFLAWGLVIASFIALTLAAKEAYGNSGFYGGIGVLLMIFAAMAYGAESILIVEIEPSQDYCWWRHLPK